MKTYEAVARTLVGCGMKTMFGLMGDANMQYIVEYMQNGGHYVGAVHETGAVAMADGYGRVTGTVGLATVTHGPGLMNTLTALDGGGTQSQSVAAAHRGDEGRFRSLPAGRRHRRRDRADRCRLRAGAQGGHLRGRFPACAGVCSSRAGRSS